MIEMALQFIYVFVTVHRIAGKIKKGLATNFIISNREVQFQKRGNGIHFSHFLLLYMKIVNEILQQFKNIVKQITKF